MQYVKNDLTVPFWLPWKKVPLFLTHWEPKKRSPLVNWRPLLFNFDFFFHSLFNFGKILSLQLTRVDFSLVAQIFSHPWYPWGVSIVEWNKFWSFRSLWHWFHLHKDLIRASDKIYYPILHLNICWCISSLIFLQFLVGLVQ